MTPAQNAQDELAKLRDAVKDVRMAMLSTVRGGKVMSRPMSTQEMSDDGTVWFLTSAESNKVREIAENPSVGISYCESSSETYVSIAGLARVINDRALIHKFWNLFYKAWFDGPDDPTIRVIEIQAQAAEYWVTKGGKIVSLISAFAAAVTGKDMEAGENKTLQL